MNNRFENAIDFSLAGCLIVAAPNWNGGFFGRSVCLVVHHDGDGAVGVFLNRILGDVPGLMDHLAGSEAAGLEQAVPLHFGGPQSGPIVALHNSADLAEYQGGEGIYLAAQLGNLQRLLAAAQQGVECRIFVGQASWGAGQLESECLDGKWLALPASADLVFAEESEMWPRAMRQVGNEFVSHLAGRVRPPRDILMN